jgi:hypothetical protein
MSGKKKEREGERAGRIKGGKKIRREGDKARRKGREIDGRN